MRAVFTALRRSLAALMGPVWRGVPTAVGVLATPVTGLHECPECRCDRVSPIAIDEADEEHWNVTLRCGECELHRDVVITNAEANDYGEALDRHTAVMQRELARLDAQRMADQADAFIQALSLDLIEPSDFAPSRPHRRTWTPTSRRA